MKSLILSKTWLIVSEPRTMQSPLFDRCRGICVSFCRETQLKENDFAAVLFSSLAMLCLAIVDVLRFPTSARAGGTYPRAVQVRSDR